MAEVGGKDMKQISLFMDGYESIFTNMLLLLQDSGKCSLCGQPIKVKHGEDMLNPEWICTNHECTNGVTYQQCHCWQNALMELIGSYMDIVLCHFQEGAQCLSREIPCPDCTGDESCETCQGKFRVYLCFVPMEKR